MTIAPTSGSQTDPIAAYAITTGPEQTGATWHVDGSDHWGTYSLVLH